MTEDSRKMLLGFEAARYCDVQDPRVGCAQQLLCAL
jgi:hypothetical protein